VNEALTADLRRALDPARFAREALGLEPDPWQERVLSGKGKRTILNCSRQSGKSTVSAVLALHRALYYPGSLVLLVSPSLRQSGELFRKVVDLVGRLEPRPSLSEDNKLSLIFDEGGRIVSLPGSEATIRGFSAVSLVILDEAARVPDDLYRSVRPMLAVSGGRLVLASTPFGKRGFFHDEWVNGGPVWERVSIPASECPRISPEFLEEERRSIGDFWFRQEFECEFLETTSQLFAYETVMAAVTPDVKPLFGGTP